LDALVLRGPSGRLLQGKLLSTDSVFVRRGDLLFLVDAPCGDFIVDILLLIAGLIKELLLFVAFI